MFPSKHLLFTTLLAAPLAAQTTISDLNASYTWFSPTATQADSVAGNFTANAASDTDVLFEHWWAYRIDSDTDETYFNSGNLTETTLGNHADLDWVDVDSRGLIDASLDIDVVSTGPTSGLVLSMMTLTNISANPITVNLYRYLDLDICSLQNNATGTGPAHNVTGTLCGAGADNFDVSPAGADRWCVAPFPSGNECGISAAGPATLSNSTLPFGPADYTSAVQWEDRVIQPGGVLVAFTSFHHNPPPACGTTAASSNYGTATAGSNGMTPAFSNTAPLVGGTMNLSWANTLPSAPGALFIGVTQANLPFFNFTLNVTNSFDIAIGSDGSGGLTLPLAISQNLCGLTLNFQGVFLDPGNTPIQVSSTDGLSLTFGS